MTGPVRITAPLLDVLEVLLRAVADGTELHGWSIMKTTKRSGPTVYGVIDRLEDAGWLTGRWEDENPEPGKPRRRLYRLTPNGVAEARALLAARRPEAAGRPDGGRGLDGARRPGTEPGFAPGLSVFPPDAAVFGSGSSVSASGVAGFRRGMAPFRWFRMLAGGAQ